MGKYQASEERETKGRNESKRYPRVGEVPKKKVKKENAWNKQNKVDKGPEVKKRQGHLMGNKERDIGEGDKGPGVKKEHSHLM